MAIMNRPLVHPVHRREHLLAHPDILVLVTNLVLFAIGPRGSNVCEELRRRRLLRFDLQHAFVLFLCHGLRVD